MQHLVCLNFPSSIGFNQCSSATILVSFSVHFCLGRKKEIINLYCNPLSIAIIFSEEGGGWNGRVHVTFFSTHYMKGTIAVLSLVYRSAGSRKIGSTQHWVPSTQYPVPSTGKFLTCFLTNLPEKCGREVQEKRDLGFLKETESGSGCESKAADHQRTPRNF